MKLTVWGKIFIVIGLAFILYSLQNASNANLELQIEVEQLKEEKRELYLDIYNLQEQIEELQSIKETSKIVPVEAVPEPVIEVAVVEPKVVEREVVKEPTRTGELSGGRDNSNKTYMDYRAITSKSSPQYKLQQDPNVYTDELGLRRLGDSYIVALGTYYGVVGDQLLVTMENGQNFTVIIGDLKANKHTCSENKQHLKDGSVLEFIVDTKQLHSLAKKMGNISYADEKFKGQIGNIQ